MKIIVEFDTEKDDVVNVDQCLSGPDCAAIIREIDAHLREEIKHGSDETKGEHYQAIRDYLLDAVNDRELMLVIFG